jgi:hypothetical protein
MIFQVKNMFLNKITKSILFESTLFLKMSRFQIANKNIRFFKGRIIILSNVNYVFKIHILINYILKLLLLLFF